MPTSRQTLRDRITRGPTFWMAGAQDALSALLVDRSDFDGVFTTGFGISATVLGQPDMEVYTLTENLAVVRRVVDVVAKPVFADADTGYGNVINVARTVREFERVGVAAISLEDQASPSGVQGGHRLGRDGAAAAVLRISDLSVGVQAKVRVGRARAPPTPRVTSREPIKEDAPHALPS